MCGIAGAIRSLLGQDPDSVLTRMNNALLHRGPDMGETYSDDDFCCCHRRLSIIDLSEDGRQPMHSDDGRYVIVFNGEIYNYLEIRKELEEKGCRFRTRTDTEVLLQAFIQFGALSLDRVNGMFAYVIWDKTKKKLFAARDRIGKKPFYYYLKGSQFAFASEIKSLLELPKIDRSLDYTAIVDYLKFLFIPHPKSIYRYIFKLPPGHHLTYCNGEVTVSEYWDVDFSVEHDANTVEDLQDDLLALLRRAVGDRMLADVPLGAFLSGGVDSSGVVKLMSEISEVPVTTCTVGFNDKRINEAKFAKEFAGELGTNHYEHYVRSDPSAILRKLCWHFDEPFADSSMVPTYYVSEMARQHVTVALSGDGGDENFAGYAKYVTDKYENIVRESIPQGILRLLQRGSGKFTNSTSCRKINSLISSALVGPVEGFHVTNSFITDVQMKSLLSSDIQSEVNGYSSIDHTQKYYNRYPDRDHLGRVLYTDIKLLLPGDFLVKVDRMSMANSLEVRSPFLDTRIIEFSAKLPSKLKLNGIEKKYLLRKTLAKVLPRKILTRRKQGFEAPINIWFRRELREMAESSFFKNPDLERFFNIEEIRRIWGNHQTGKSQSGTLLWSILMFALWLEIELGRERKYVC